MLMMNQKIAKKKNNIMRVILFFIWGLSILPIAIYAKNTSSGDDALEYQTKPIDAACFVLQDDQADVIDLTKCGVKNQPDLKVMGHNELLEKKGYVGANYKMGYSYYRVVGHVGPAYIVHTVNSGGGSGEFTAVLQVIRKGNKLHIKALDAGDRCNGGIDNVSLHDTTVQYHKNITAADFLDLSRDNPHGFKAYRDLSACAACCVATARYEYYLDDSDKAKQLLDIDLGSPAVPVQDDHSAQACFDQQINASQKSGKQVLTPAEFFEWMHIFNQKCGALKQTTG